MSELKQWWPPNGTCQVRKYMKNQLVLFLQYHTFWSNINIYFNMLKGRTSEDVYSKAFYALC